jgi:hypothetical protein
MLITYTFPDGSFLAAVLIGPSCEGPDCLTTSLKTLCRQHSQGHVIKLSFGAGTPSENDMMK